MPVDQDWLLFSQTHLLVLVPTGRQQSTPLLHTPLAVPLAHQPNTSLVEPTGQRRVHREGPEHAGGVSERPLAPAAYRAPPLAFPVSALRSVRNTREARSLQSKLLRCALGKQSPPLRCSSASLDLVWLNPYRLFASSAVSLHRWWTTPHRRCSSRGPLAPLVDASAPPLPRPRQSASPRRGRARCQAGADLRADSGTA